MAAAGHDTAFDALLEYLKGSRGFDFTGYKRPSLERRIRKRMAELQIDDVADYHDHLEVHQDEFPRLFDTILINVTSFFRDPQAWDHLRSDVVPRILEARADGGPIRVWCAGCASGEETYTTAMVLAEALGTDPYIERVKIYATEIDEDALAQARLGSYGPNALDSVPPELRDRYFERGDQRYSFRKDLRRTIIFGRNDLTQDAPISRIDLLLCRNTLMYFNAETQARILNRLHFALNPSGLLFLGKSEMLVTHTDLFRPVNLRRRVFAKVTKTPARAHPVAPPEAEVPAGLAHPATVREAAFDVSPTAVLVVDADDTLVMANAEARSLLSVSASDIGRPLGDVEASYRPVELRANIQLARAENRTIAVSGVEFNAPGGEARTLDVQVLPLRSGEEALGAGIVFHDVTRQRRTELELETARRELSTAYEELQSTVEELETTNEELQSTNEELETTNEELQSTVEELETMNEELQSANEELETMNEELSRRSVDLNEVNAMFERILATLNLGVIVVDRDLAVRVWNRESEELWGVRPDEARGQQLWGLDIGLPMDGVGSGLREVLAGREQRVDVEIDATNRRGRAVKIRVSCVPVGAGEGLTNGALLVVELLAGDGENGRNGDA